MSEGQTAGNLTELFPGWWMRQSRLYHTNSGLFTSEGAAVLIDPGIYPDEIETIADFVAAHGLDIQAVLLTHSHWDHILGASRFPGRPIITHQAFSETAAQSEALILQEIGRLDNEIGKANRRAFRLPRPEITFASSLTLQVGRETIELIAAPGHAPDQFAIYQPNCAILWAADMLSDLEIPLVQSSLKDYLHTLDGLETLNLQGSIPGHGSVASEPEETAARLANDHGYLSELNDRVSRAVASGGSLEEALQRCQAIPYQQERAENAQAHRRNVEAAYLEAGGSDPSAAGWRSAA